MARSLVLRRNAFLAGPLTQMTATRAFAGARVILKGLVQNGPEHCILFITRLMADTGTVLAEEDWLRLAGFAP